MTSLTLNDARGRAAVSDVSIKIAVVRRARQRREIDGTVVFFAVVGRVGNGSRVVQADQTQGQWLGHA